MWKRGEYPATNDAPGGIFFSGGILPHALRKSGTDYIKAGGRSQGGEVPLPPAPLAASLPRGLFLAARMCRHVVGEPLVAFQRQVAALGPGAAHFLRVEAERFR